ncbi:MAG: hypothetical protein KTR31_32230 [Myxococcales bacterium]|nr:hypothetical protein [Myxococcales bacterium]
MIQLLMATALADPGAGSQLRVGITVPYATQPGLRVELQRAVASTLKRTTLTAGGEVAAYTQLGDHSSLLGGGTVALRRMGSRGFGSAVVLGFAYTADVQTTHVGVDLATGETVRRRRLRHRLLPTLGGQLSWANHRRVGPYLGARLGPHLAFDGSGAFFFAFDAGVHTRLGRPAAGGAP